MSVIIDTEEENGIITTPKINMAKTGPNGPLPVKSHWNSNAAEVPQQLIAKLYSVPSAIQYLENPEQIIATLKALVETWPQSITGLTNTINWEYAQTPTGHNNDMFDSPNDGKYAASEPTFVYSEKYGSAIRKFLTYLNTRLIYDPLLGKPGIIYEPAYISAGSPPLLPEQISMSVVFFEPNNTLTSVTWAWWMTNMMPKTSGEIASEMSLGAAKDIPEVSIPYTGYPDRGMNAYAIATRFLQSLSLEDMDPFTKTNSFYDVGESVETPDVEAAGNGYAEAIIDPVNPSSSG